MREIITREQLRSLLIQWRNSALSEKQLHEWAENKYQNHEVDYSDWENDDNSVTNEVLATLDMMDMNLMTKEDIKYYLDFLDTPLGQFAAGLKKLEDNLKAINFTQRKKSLANNQFYEKFCR
jgi:hypothetical protein